MQNQQFDFWTCPPDKLPSQGQQVVLIKLRQVTPPPPMTPAELQRLYRSLEPDVPY